MIEVQAFAVLDMAAKIFDEPFFDQTVEAGIRGFKLACETEGTKMNRFPDDFALYHVGKFEKEEGVFTPIVPHKVAMAVNYVQPTVPMRYADSVEDAHEMVSVDKLRGAVPQADGDGS